MALSKSIGSLVLMLSEKQEANDFYLRNKIYISYILDYIMNGVKNILKVFGYTDKKRKGKKRENNIYHFFFLK